MAAIKIKPAHGLLVHHPDGRQLDAAGAIVELNAYWRRQLRADAVEVVPDKPKPKPKPENDDKPDSTTTPPQE